LRVLSRSRSRAFFWDGRVSTLEEQVLEPIQDPNEMDLPLVDAARRVGLSSDDLSRALASYVRSILSGDSPLDRFINGERNALSAEQQAGLHNTGIAWRDGQLTDAGAGNGTFKTPTLREIARTSPYIHDGSIRTLEEIVDFYDNGGRSNPGIDPEIHPLHLSVVDKQAVVAFLKSLSGAIRDVS
jgi:cytochrome c peroxidase